MKAISLHLEDKQHKRLRKLSLLNKRPVTEIISEAIDNYLKQNQPPKPGQEWFWAKTWQEEERLVEKELQAGNYETFDTMEEFLENLA